jgi:hypothetical protein
MLNEDNAATRLAVALIDIIEGVKVYSLDVIKIDADIVSQFHEHCQKQGEILRGQYPNLRPHELPDIQLRVLKNGKAQYSTEAATEQHRQRPSRPNRKPTERRTEQHQ